VPGRVYRRRVRVPVGQRAQWRQLARRRWCQRVMGRLEGSLTDELQRWEAAAVRRRRSCAGGSRSWLSAWRGSWSGFRGWQSPGETVDEVLSEAGNG
jgi:hypothetical protein